MIDIIIPAIVYIAIFYFFEIKVFWIMVLIGAIIGIGVIVWLFLEKDPVFRDHQKNLFKHLKIAEKEIVIILKDLFSIK
jgi:hypothetical protein